MTKRSIEPYIGLWHLPGGTVYYNEKLEEAVYRVAKDELGIDVKIRKHIGWIYYSNSIREESRDWPIGTAFELSKTSGSYVPSDQGEEISFFKTLPNNIIPEQREFLIEHGYFKNH